MRRDPPIEWKIALAIDIRQAFELGGQAGQRAVKKYPLLG
jgi:hypothetical protein